MHGPLCICEPHMWLYLDVSAVSQTLPLFCAAFVCTLLVMSTSSTQSTVFPYTVYPLFLLPLLHSWLCFSQAHESYYNITMLSLRQGCLGVCVKEYFHVCVCVCVWYIVYRSCLTPAAQSDHSVLTPSMYARVFPDLDGWTLHLGHKHTFPECIAQHLPPQSVRCLCVLSWHEAAADFGSIFKCLLCVVIAATGTPS